jgi:hypothetical protein
MRDKDKVSRKLSYDPTPNMAGLFDDTVPQAAAPQPVSAMEPESPPLTVRVVRAADSPPAPEIPHETVRPRSERPSPASRPRPVTKTPRTAQRGATSRAPSVVSEPERIRRTLRIPQNFDKMLRELAKALGVNLNSAILASIEAEWQRRHSE